MKKYFTLILATQLAFISQSFSQNIAINGTGSLPDTSAMLDISSTNKGFLAPRMTTSQQNAIPLPAKGLLVFNITDNVFKVNTGTTAAPVWSTLLTNSGVAVNDWNTSGNGTVDASNFLGSTNNSSVRFRTNNIERMILDSTGNLGIRQTLPGSALDIKGTLRLSGSTSGYIGLQPSAAAGSTTYVLPSSDGTSGQMLSTNGSGLLSWSTPAAGASSTGWALTGNNGTGSSNYIGTSDGQPLIFKINGTQAGYLGLSGSSYATAYGVGSGANFKSTAVGASAAASASNEATALGYSATAAGYRSVALGSSSVTGNVNEAIAVGYDAQALSYQNIAIGSGSRATTNNNAIAIGVGATATGYQSSAVGFGATASAQNSTAIGNGATVSNANYISIGNTTVAAIRGQVNFTTYSDGRFKRNIKADVPGLDFITKLRPVTYTWDIHQFNSHSQTGTFDAIATGYNADEEAAIRKKESIKYTGFIAQEVEKAANDCNYNFSGVLKPLDNKDAYSLSYAEFVVPLVKATQQLNEKNLELSRRLDEQQKVIEKLLQQIKSVKK